MPEESIRQKLFNAVKYRFQDIRVVNGYQTELGAKCFPWRDLQRSPFAAEELPAFTIRDVRCESAVGGDWAKINKHQHNLTIEVLASARAADSNPPDNFARLMLADLEDAIGQDRYWTMTINEVPTRLARETLPGDDAMDAAHGGDRIVSVRKTFAVIFVTNLFDPYTQ